MECVFMCILHSWDRNGFIRKWSKHISRFGALRRSWHKGEPKMDSQDASVCAESSAAPGSDGVVVRGWGVESIYWCGYLVLWQAGPLNQPAMARLRQALHAHPHTSGEEASAKPNLINKCSSPVPQLSEMKMILRGSEQSDGDSTGRNRERQKEREKETEWDLRVVPPPRLGFLKAKCLSTGKQGDNALVYFNKNHVPRNTPFTRSKSRAFICWRQSHINYQKLELKNKNLSVQ